MLLQYLFTKQNSFVKRYSFDIFLLESPIARAKPKPPRKMASGGHESEAMIPVAAPLANPKNHYQYQPWLMPQIAGLLHIAHIEDRGKLTETILTLLKNTYNGYYSENISEIKNNNILLFDSPSTNEGLQWTRVSIKKYLRSSPTEILESQDFQTSSSVHLLSRTNFRLLGTEITAAYYCSPQNGNKSITFLDYISTPLPRKKSEASADMLERACMAKLQGFITGEHNHEGMAYSNQFLVVDELDSFWNTEGPLHRYYQMNSVLKKAISIDYGDPRLKPKKEILEMFSKEMQTLIESMECQK